MAQAISAPRCIRPFIFLSLSTPVFPAHGGAMPEAMPMQLISSKEYMRPTAAIRPPLPCPDLWTPPAESGWLREFKFASKASSRGVLVAKGRRINWESRGERNALLKFLADRDTIKVVEQSPRVEWMDEWGEMHEHVFDMLVTKRVGRSGVSKVAVDVKPESKVKSSGIRKLHLVLCDQMSSDVADELLVFTEKKFTAADLHNVELFYSVFRQEYPDDDAVILGLIRKMKGPTRIADLVAASGLDGYGLNAVARAIAVGHLALVDPVRITASAVVSRPSRA